MLVQSFINTIARESDNIDNSLFKLIPTLGKYELVRFPLAKAEIQDRSYTDDKYTRAVNDVLVYLYFQ